MAKEQNAVEAAMQQSIQPQHAPVKGEKKKSVFDVVSSQNSFAGLRQTDIADYLGAMKGRLVQSLPKHLTPERFVQIASTAIAKTPQLTQCTPTSLIGAVMQASILGFPPAEALGYCYFVPYGKECQFQIGYKGYIELARRSGKVKMVYAEVVREGDDFEVEYGLFPKLHHKSAFDTTKKMTHVYAVAHYNDGGYNFVVLPRAEVERLRMRSPMQKNGLKGAWATDYEAMAKTKAVKQLAKYMPLTLDQLSALASDEQVISMDNIKNGEYKVEDAVYTEINDDTTNQ